MEGGAHGVCGVRNLQRQDPREGLEGLGLAARVRVVRLLDAAGKHVPGLGRALAGQLVSEAEGVSDVLLEAPALLDQVLAPERLELAWALPLETGADELGGVGLGCREEHLGGHGLRPGDHLRDRAGAHHREEASGAGAQQRDPQALGR